MTIRQLLAVAVGVAALSAAACTPAERTETDDAMAPPEGTTAPADGATAPAMPPADGVMPPPSDGTIRPPEKAPQQPDGSMAPTDTMTPDQ